MNLGKEIRRIRKSLKKTQDEFALALGFDQGYISSIETGRKPLTESFLDTVEDKFPELDTSHIKAGIMEYMAFQSHNINETIFNEPLTSYKTSGVPVYDLEFSAGSSIILAEAKENKHEIGRLDIPELKGCDAVIKARGNSMAPRINDKDWIGIKHLQNWREFIPPGYIYAIITNDLEIIKYIRKGSTTSTLLITSHNTEEYESFELPVDLIREIWAVRAIIPASKIETII